MKALTRAIGLGVILAFGGWSFLAFSQPTPPMAEPVSVAAPPSPEHGSDIALLAYLVQSMGLPGVLAWLGWQLGRSGGVPVRVTVEMSGEDRKLLDRIDESVLRHLARSDQHMTRSAQFMDRADRANRADRTARIDQTGPAE